MVRDIEIYDKIDDSLVIWRYMDFASLYALLQSKSLFFRRLDKYTDQYEGALPDEVISYLIDSWSSFPLFSKEDSQKMVDDFCSRLRGFNTGTLCNSWVLNEKEVYAMWKIYLRGSSEGVAIRTTVGKLRNALSDNDIDFTLAKVSYDVLSWLITDYRTLATYKSKPYSYESELRVLVYNQFEQDTIPIDIHPKKPLYENGHAYNVLLEELISQVYVSPFAGHWFQDVVKSSLNQLLPNFDVNNIITSRIKDR